MSDWLERRFQFTVEYSGCRWNQTIANGHEAAIWFPSARIFSAASFTKFPAIPCPLSESSTKVWFIFEMPSLLGKVTSANNFPALSVAYILLDSIL